MIDAKSFLSEALKYDFGFFTGTPCSYLKPFINSAIDHEQLLFVDAVNEGDAVALASGYTLSSGKKSVVMFQNSGLGNAVNPLTSLSSTFKIPILLIITLRGDPQAMADEPQHKLMGQVTSDLLDLLGIPWAYFPDNQGSVADILTEVSSYFEQEQKPFALIMKKGDVAPYELQASPVVNKNKFELNYKEVFDRSVEDRSTRSEALRVIRRLNQGNCVLLASTGKIGRELYSLGDVSDQFYMVGSMGCVLSLGMGVSLGKKGLQVIVIDGDGSLLMRMGSMATIGAYQPSHLIHIVLDNEAHDSTGGQKTVADQISFGAIAAGCGYKNVNSTDGLREFEQALLESCQNSGPSFLHFKIKKGSLPNLPRPKIAPHEVAIRFANHIKKLS